MDILCQLCIIIVLNIYIGYIRYKVKTKYVKYAYFTKKLVIF